MTLLNQSKLGTKGLAAIPRLCQHAAKNGVSTRMAQALAATPTPTPTPVTTLGRLLESTLARPVRISSIMAVTPLADYLSVVVPGDLLAGPQY
jgi:DNA-directed RNA polymerase subunit N (RpoN/RPB10)